MRRECRLLGAEHALERLGFEELERLKRRLLRHLMAAGGPGCVR